MPKLIRFDSPIKFTGPPRRVAGDFLEVDGIAASVKVLEYSDADGVRLENVPAETLRESIATLEGAPVTLGHPRRADGSPEFVTPENSKEYTVGFVLRASYDEEEQGQLVVLRITRQDAIDAVESGEITELSPGYLVAHEDAEEGEPYHVHQIFRENNHLAIVRKGRGGPKSSIRLDDAGHATFKQEKDLEKEELQKLLDEATARADKAEDEVSTLRAKVDSLEGENAALKRSEKIDEKPDDFPERFKAHREVLAVVEEMELKADEDASTEDLKLLVVQDSLGEDCPEKPEAAFVDAAYAIIRKGKNHNKSFVYPKEGPKFDSNELDLDTTKIVDPTKIMINKGAK